MVMEFEPSESRQMSQADRKRQLSGGKLKEYVPPTMVNAGTQSEEPNKRLRPEVANNGWGELFKNKETFAEMHIF